MVSVLELAKSKTLININNQNQDINGNNNTQDQFASTIPVANQNAEGDLIDQIQDHTTLITKINKLLEMVTILTKIFTMEQLKIKMLMVTE